MHLATYGDVPTSEKDVSVVPASGSRWGIIRGVAVKPFNAYTEKAEAVAAAREMAKQAGGILFVLDAKACVEKIESYDAGGNN